MFLETDIEPRIGATRNKLALLNNFISFADIVMNIHICIA